MKKQKQVLTVSCKIQATPEQSVKIDETLQAFADASEHINSKVPGLRSFMVYKTVKFGVKLIFVDPRYTSQTCHKCLHIHPVKGESYRSGKSFKCGHCGWSGDADFNGANVISAIGAAVNQPRGSGLSCELVVLLCESRVCAA